MAKREITIPQLTKKEAKKRIPFMQVAIYVMCGGGFIGRSFAEQPQGAYIDTRVSKRPYKVREIYAARVELIGVAKIAGYDPNNLPAMPNFGNMAGTF